MRELAPNILTLAALCLGLSSIRFCLLGQFDLAALCIVAAAVLDAFDGRVARLLRVESPIGAQLDSLADFVNFGIAPIFYLYLWALQTSGRFAWLVLLLYGACCALRLARYNITLDDDTRPSWKSRFFSGIPSPAAGGLVLLPVAFYNAEWIDLRFAPPLLLAVVVAISALMVSPLPTLSFRVAPHIIPFASALPLMLGSVLFVAALLTYPWGTLSAVGVIYILSLPVGVLLYRRMDD